MGEKQRSEDIAAYNERSLKVLDRAISLSLGEFSLVLVRCNYKHLRDRTLRQLRKILQQRYQIRELVLPTSAKTLYTTILANGYGELATRKKESNLSGENSKEQNEIAENELPFALFILGLDSVVALEDLLSSSNQVRDDFRKRLPFPLVLWVNDEVLQKLVKFAPDLASWAATPIKFEIATSELIDLLQYKADALFTKILYGSNGRYAPWRFGLPHDSLNGENDCRSKLEIESAFKDLQSRQEAIKPELEASLQFIFGQYDYVNNQSESAIENYQKSLRFWRHINNLERQGVLLFYIGLCYCRIADLHPLQRHRNLEEAWPYLLQCIDIFTQAKREDLVAVFITQLAEVLQRLEAWDALQILGQKSLNLHQTYGSKVQLAQDYGFLAEVALKQARWAQTKQSATQALAILAEVNSKPIAHQGLHRFLLAQFYQLFLVKSLREQGQIQESLDQLEKASEGLKKAIELSEHRYEPQRYLYLLEELRTLYFEEGQYLEAFWIKQEQRSVEQLYGFRAFIGAARLQPQRLVNNPNLALIEQPEIVALEIATSGRQQDVNRLIERISRADHKLTVIHGQSGVGKSSLVSAGLVPALKYKPLGDRIALPIVPQVYSDWVRELGKSLAEALLNFGTPEGEEPINLDFKKVLDSQQRIDNILAQLRENAEHNWLTVLIFDQFEEFFQSANNQAQRLLFYDFLKKSLDLPFVKIILSLREDQLHYLLEVEQFNIEPINNNILDKNIRYSLGNFSKEDAHSVIKSLTQRAHFYLEAALIDELVGDLAGELKTVRPIELQVVGAQLQAEGITTLEQYRQAGTKEKLVERFLEKVIKDCGPENEHAAWLVLYLLTDDNNNRPFKTLTELAIEANIEAEKLDLILEILEKSGLLFLFPEVPANRYQLVHDYLVEFIRQKEQLKIQTELDDLRKKNKQTQDEIEKLRAELREKELRAKLAQATAIQRRTETKLNQVLKQNLRKTRIALVALAIVSFIAIILGLRATISERNAKISEKIAKLSENEAKIDGINARLSDLSTTSEALVASNREFDALLTSLSAGRQLKQSMWATTTKTKTRVITALQQAVYGVRERNRLEGHTDWVSSVSFSPDGQRIASASKDSTIKLWNKDGTLYKEVIGNDKGVYSIIFSPDGQIIASASENKTVKLWSKDGVFIKTLKGHTKPVYSVTFSPDGQMLATASGDKTVKLWSKNGVLLKTLKGHTDNVLGVSFSPDGELIASVSRDQRLILRRRDGTFLKSWKAHDKAVTSVSFSPDGKKIASASADNTINLWSRDGVLLQTLTGHTNWVYKVTFSPDGKKIASASADNTIKIWKTDGTLQETLKGHGNSVHDLSFSPNGQTLASASADNMIKLWEFSDKLLKIIDGHSNAIASVSFSPDGEMIATASWDKTVQLRRIRDGVKLAVLEGHTKRVTNSSFSPDGKIIATASDDKTIKLWSKDGTLLKTLRGHKSPVTSVTFSPDGKTIASSSEGTTEAPEDTTVKLWNTDGNLLSTLKGHTAKVSGVSFSPDGMFLASASEDKKVKIWNRDGTLVNTLKENNSAVNWVTFSPDGKLIATANSDATVKLWDLEGKLINSLKGHNGRVNWVSFSPDGKLIASASDDKTVNLWTKEGIIKTLEGHKNAVYGVNFSPDGKLLASASKDKTVILWNLDLDDLLKRGCGWLGDYLENNRNRQNMNYDDLCKY